MHNKNFQKRCAVCGRPAALTICANSVSRFLCSACDEYFFKDLLCQESKLERLILGVELAKAEGLSLGYAINVVCGRYSLEEAKKRNRLKQRENNGKSVDMFVVGKRLPGSYK